MLLEQIFALVRPIQKTNDIKQSRLAAAGRPHHGDKLAFADGQINFIERIVRRVAYTVYFCKFFKLNYRPCCLSRCHINLL